MFHNFDDTRRAVYPAGEASEVSVPNEDTNQRESFLTRMISLRFLRVLGNITATGTSTGPGRYKEGIAYLRKIVYIPA
jgi:hypothetical protein